MKTISEWIKIFNYQPLLRIPLKREEIKLIQLDARKNFSYPCKHGVLNYCAICEFNL
jgi:hypothetical protein